MGVRNPSLDKVDKSREPCHSLEGGSESGVAKRRETKQWEID
jgi:hypothetical protein